MAIQVLAEIGLSEPEVTLVKTAIDLASGFEIGAWRFADDPISANVLLVDVDGNRQHDLIESLVGDESDDAFCVVACSSGQSDTAEFTHSLQRPLTYASLVSLLKRVEAQISSAALSDHSQVPVLTESFNPLEAPIVDTSLMPESEESGIEPFVYLPVDANVFALRSASSASRYNKQTKIAAEMIQMKNRPAMRFYRYTRLLGLIHSVVDNNKPVFLSNPQLPSLLICPERGLFGSLGPIDIEPELFRTPAYKFHVQEISAEHLQEMMADFVIQPIWALLYSAALLGSEGRLLEYFCTSDILSLRGMPDFSKVPHSDEHISLAKYLLANQADVLTLAEETGVDLHTTIDFCNACEEAELMDRQSLHVIEDEQSENQVSSPAMAVGDSGMPLSYAGSQKKTKFRHKVSSVFSLDEERARLRASANKHNNN